MKQFLLSVGSDKNYDRILKGGITSILISVTMFTAFLPGIFNR